MSDLVKDHMTLMPHSIRIDMQIENAIDMMKKYSCHHLPVLDGGKLVGIISDTDIKRIRKLPNNLKFKVEVIMSEDPVMVQPEDDIFQVTMLMFQKEIGSVIVSGAADEPWGIFTSTDALSFLNKS